MQRAKSVRTSGVPEGANFAVPDRYRFVKALGSGSYGVVACFHDTVRGRDVAIKRVRHVFDNFLVLRRTAVARRGTPLAVTPPRQALPVPRIFSLGGPTPALTAPIRCKLFVREPPFYEQE